MIQPNNEKNTTDFAPNGTNKLNFGSAEQIYRVNRSKMLMNYINDISQPK